MNNFQDAEYLSQEGFDRLKAELKSLKNEKRKEIASRLEYAKGLGDLSENSEYHEAKEAQLENEGRIVELEDVLARSVIMSKAPAKNNVAIGSTVVVARAGSSDSFTYILVGSEESNPIKSKISYGSPLGRALLGRKKGEEVKVVAPRGEIKYKILDIM
ncbi:MAG: transcription elongation factor GreA [Candidatus Niyogibacteria bacterium]|nr:MAG: transcription elongation factor GreA [Candidatus Niyogibacteria bacterium]